MIHSESEPEREGKLISFPFSIKSLKFIVPLLDLLSSTEAHSMGNVKNQRNPRDDKKVSHASKPPQANNRQIRFINDLHSGACKTYRRKLQIERNENETKQPKEE